MIATALSDAELLAQARQGDEAAFTELYVRHQAAARRLASTYRRAGDPDDLVNESFERILGAIKRGAGPEEAFRAYLFVTLRRLATDRIAHHHDEPVDEVPEPVRSEEAEPALEVGERELVLAAYESLPERWQAVLWQTAVEGRQPRELAPDFGMSANAAAALAYRAREKLRQAYLQAHLQAAPRPECEPHRSRLGAYVRDGLGRRDRSATEGHVRECAACRGLVMELRDIDRMLVRSVQPYFLAGAATSALAGVAGGAGGAVGAGAARRVWTKARSNPGVAAVAAAAAALAVGLVVARDGEKLVPERRAPREEAAAPPADADAPASPGIGIVPPGGPDPTEAVAAREPVAPTTNPTQQPAALPPAQPPSEAPAVTTPPTSASPAPTAPGTTAPPVTTTTTPPPSSPPPSPPPTNPPPLLLDAELGVNLLGIHLDLDLEL
jgi:RNA polymerase sigma factor (sigma-70 family)